MVWEGWNGRLFDLSNGSEGLALRPGVRGLNAPEWDRYRTESPGTAGSRYRGSRGQEREVFWPLAIYSNENSEAWAEWDRAFWATMSPRQTGRWHVTRDGKTRSLSCRFVSDGGHAFDIDPGLVGWASYGITLVAEQPFWEGTPVEPTFSTNGPGTNFFGASAGPPFNISPSNTISTATIDNDGDEPAWPVWTLTGPFATASVGVNGRSISVPFALLAGEKLVIDSSPKAQTAIHTSATGVVTSRTGLITPNFAEVPAGKEVPLAVTLDGLGSFKANITPLYWRAW